MSTELYDRRIVELAREAGGAARLASPSVTVERDNPLCGDRIALDVELADGRVRAVGHRTRGCLLTRAAAVLVARHAPGAAPSELRRAIADLEAVLRGEGSAPSWPELAIFAPVSQVKSRWDCVLLPFRALAEALDRAGRGSGREATD